MIQLLLLLTLAGAPAPAMRPPVAIADSVVIHKRAHRLTLYHMGRPLRSYRVGSAVSAA